MYPRVFATRQDNQKIYAQRGSYLDIWELSIMVSQPHVAYCGSVSSPAFHFFVDLIDKIPLVERLLIGQIF
jgi:hypothetical protein